MPGRYGERGRRRLTGEMTIWLTTAGRDGTPQPDPAGFGWDGGGSLQVKFAERFSVPVRIRLTRVCGLKGTRHMARSRAVMNAPVTGGIVLVPALPPPDAGTRLHRR